MRIVVLGDIHGNLEALSTTVEEAARVGYDRIFHTGDLVGYGARPNESIDLVRDRGIKGVRGEFDQSAAWEGDPPHVGEDEREKAQADGSHGWTVKRLGFSQKNFLKDLPFSIDEQIGDWRVVLFHASPTDMYVPIDEDATESYLEEMAEKAQADILLFGHTHRPFHRVVNGRHFVNAGSVGRPMDGDPRACLAIIDFNGKINVELRRVAYDVEKTARDIEASGLPGEIASRLRTGT